MTTKEQERKALEKIKKIIAELGENSYVGTAFEGCFADAEDNIENDWAMSMNGRLQDAEYRIEQFKAIRDQLVEENRALNQRIHEMNMKIADFTEEIGARDLKITEMQEQLLEERKDVTIETIDGDKECKPFAKIQFFPGTAFPFINVVEKSGWTNSYKISDLKTFEIQ